MPRAITKTVKIKVHAGGDTRDKAISRARQQYPDYSVVGAKKIWTAEVTYLVLLKKKPKRRK